MFILFTMTTREYTAYLDALMEKDSHWDISLNGVQIGAEEKPLGKVAFAVDACLETIGKAVEAGADVLVVHHGLFWGTPLAIEGSHLRRVKTAIDGGLVLYACHIPLDCHPVYGNNARIADAIGLEDRRGFGEWKGNTVGVAGRLGTPLSVDEIKERLDFNGRAVFIDGAGKDKYSSVAIVSGSGGDDAPAAIEEGYELLITGEVGHEMYHTAKEAGLSILAGGHYRSETFGVKALKELTEEKFGVETIFIEADTGL